MAKKYTEIGELRESEATDDKPKSLYLKIFINKKNGGQVVMKSGDVIKLEDPKLKYERMINAGSSDVDKLTEEMNNIPAYVKRRATLVQEE